MTQDNFTCKQCGNCCTKLDGYNTTCSNRDVRRWEKLGRYDILQWVCSLRVGKNRWEHQVWINSETDMEVERCPFLRKVRGQAKYLCRIHDVKPERCREWGSPTKEFALEIGCKGYE